MKRILLILLIFPKFLAGHGDSCSHIELLNEGHSHCHEHKFWHLHVPSNEGIIRKYKDWIFGVNAFASLVFDHQGGKRGKSDVYSENYLSLTAIKPFSQSVLVLNSRFSLEPFTIGKRGYPLLLQVGGTANNKTFLVDAQHPHDLFSELSMNYIIKLNEDSNFNIYLGLPGAPALGPTGIQVCNIDLAVPESPLLHEALYSTEISYGVVTAGYNWRNITLEGSIFNGRETDKNHFIIHKPKLDSFCGRLTTIFPYNLSAQISYGFLNSPEIVEPEINKKRLVVSLGWFKEFEDSYLQTMFGFAQNKHIPGNTTKGLIAEFLYNFKRNHSLFLRGELLETDELFHDEHGHSHNQDNFNHCHKHDVNCKRKNGLEIDRELFDKIFNVGRISSGYLYKFPPMDHIRFGLGCSGNISIIPEKLKPIYGNHPLSYYIYAQFELV